MNTLSFQCKHRYSSGFELAIEFSSDQQIVALFGQSGSGKTSILSMIAGFTDPTDGKIQIGDQILFDSSNRINVPAEKRHIGLVSQEHLLFPHMNVEANLRYGLRRYLSHSANNSDELFDRVGQVLELEPLMSRYPKTLSGGESQRVAIGRALMSRPSILLLDEPLSSLDAALKTQILAYLEQIIDQWKIPTIFVSHRQGHVRRLAQWVIVIEDGKGIAEGVPDDALTHSRPMAWKNSTGPVNLLRVNRVRQKGQHWIGDIGDQHLQIPTASGPADCMFVQFSPRDVTLSRHDVEGLSSRNCLHGTVRQIVSLPHGEFVAIDLDQIIWAEVTSESVQELGLQPGSPVTCYIKSQSLIVV